MMHVGSKVVWIVGNTRVGSSHSRILADYSKYEFALVVLRSARGLAECATKTRGIICPFGCRMASACILARAPWAPSIFLTILPT
jgi:hypothetical protein